MDKDFESIRSKVMKLQALAERGEKGESHKRKAFVRPTVSQIRCFVRRNSRSAGRKTTVHFQRKGKRVRIYLVYPMLFQCNKRKADELPPAQKIRYR